MSVMSMPLGEGAISAQPQEANPGRRPPPKRQFVAKADFATAPEPR